MSEPISSPTNPEKKSASWFPKILLALVAVVGVLAAVVALQPDEFRIERSTTIAAPVGVVFAQVNDFHNWQAWSPWAKLDPAAKNSFEGPESGTGSVFRWAGNNEVGEGSMTILDSHPDELVRIELAFIKPFEGKSTAEFAFQPSGDETKVTWSMYGRHGFMEKAICLMMNMDKVVGGKFDEGLASLKQVAEAKKSEPTNVAEPAS